jgi:hypothetical protein
VPPQCLDTTSELESCGGCRFGLFEGPTVVDEATVFVQNARLLRGFSKRDAAPDFRSVLSLCANQRALG